MAEGNVEGKIDDLTRTVNRLSQQLDVYAQNDPKMAKKMAKIDNPDEEDEDGDENEVRGNWGGHLDFLLSCLGYAVGLGNVWRFPYLCYKNGGAVFFIPYVIMLVIVGIPIMLLELSLGQFTSSGPLTCWECVPIFKGIGVAMCIVSGLVGIYYNMIIAWALYYLFASFTSKLPWETCSRDNWWQSDYCEGFLAPTDAQNCTAMGFNTTSVGVCMNGTQPYGFWNLTMAEDNGFKRILPTEDYLNGKVLGKNFGDMDNMGPIRWDLTLSLLGAWIIVIAALIKGVKSSGKVVYFTALFPYVVLVILLIRGVTLEGHFKGIEFYILQPDLSKLANSGVWKDAAVQIFFSLSDSWGGLIALASYNKFHNDCVRDTLIVSIGNCLTSFFAGFVIFSFLGFLAHELDTTVDNVAESGVGLAFIVYPAAVVRMPVSPLWAILFFMMLITLGLDSEFALVETVCTGLMDQFPKLRKKSWAVILCTGIVGFLLGLSLCCNGGAYMLQIMDHYSGGWNVLVIAFCECLCIAYFYGFCRYKEDIRVMIGNTPCCCFPWNACYPWWGACYYVLTPVGVLFILIYSFIQYNEVTYGDYIYPSWATALGWLMTIVVVLGIVVTAIIQVFRYSCDEDKEMIELIRPTRYWGPALPKHRRLMATYLPEGSFEIDPWGNDEGIVTPADVKMEMGNMNPGYSEKM